MKEGKAIVEEKLDGMFVVSAEVLSPVGSSDGEEVVAYLFGGVWIISESESKLYTVSEVLCLLVSKTATAITNAPITKVLTAQTDLLYRFQHGRGTLLFSSASLFSLI